MTAIALPHTPIRPARAAAIVAVVVGDNLSRFRFYPRFLGAPACSYRECKSGYRQDRARMLGRNQTIAGA